MSATVVAKSAARKVNASSFSTVKSPLAKFHPVIKKTTGMKISLGDCDFV